MFPHDARERRYSGDGACPEPVERVSRTLQATTSDLRLLISESLVLGPSLQKSVVANTFGTSAPSFGPDFLARFIQSSGSDFGTLATFSRRSIWPKK